jgi:dTDP-4-amino-4,6-dideoxygalactose transaminase
VIYDAAHAFGVEKDGKSILIEGDMAALSFHATKTYNTVEGGALVCHDAAAKKRIDYLKNFGFAGETEVVMPGINGKLDELRAAYGIVNLQYVEAAIERRRCITLRYREGLKNIAGITMMEAVPEVRYNHSYFPVFVHEKEYGLGRDTLYEKLKARGIHGRRYFYPLISAFTPYRALASASVANLPVAQKLAERVICLPLHHKLRDEEIDAVIEVIRG